MTGLTHEQLVAQTKELMQKKDIIEAEVKAMEEVLRSVRMEFVLDADI